MPRKTPGGRTPKQDVSVRLRRKSKIVKRDGHKCHYCGVSVKFSKLTIDHVVPICRGGSESDLANMVCACDECNFEKRDIVMTPAEMAAFKLMRTALRVASERKATKQ